MSQAQEAVAKNISLVDMHWVIDVPQPWLPSLSKRLPDVSFNYSSQQGVFHPVNLRLLKCDRFELT